VHKALVLLLWCGVALASSNREVQQTPVAPTNAPLETSALVEKIRTEDPASADAGDEQRIGTGDLLDITVFQVPELTRKVKVNTHGLIQLPLVGSFPASGLTTEQLEADLTKKLSATFLQNPQVSVAIEDSPRGRLTVTGSVRSPGVFPLQARTSLLQAIAMAGGPDKGADERKIAVFRNTPKGRVVAMFDLKQIRTGKAADPELKGDDIVIVDRNGAKAFLGGMFEALRNVVTFGALL